MKGRKIAWFFTMLIVNACSDSNDNKTIVRVNNENAISQIKEQPGNILTRAKETSVSNIPRQTTPDLDYKSDSLNVFFKKQYEVEYYKRGIDTLEIVSGSEYPYYPFGHCRDVASLKSHFPTFTFQSEKDSTAEPMVLQRGTYKNSFIKLVYDTDKKQMQIVSGKIADSGITLPNGIFVGMSRQQLLNVFLKSERFVKDKQFRIVQITSVVDGIRHFYTLEGNGLKSIEFNTDYTLNKL